MTEGEKIILLKEKLSDKRSKRVVFISNCLINENTRYLGGAFAKGIIDEVIDELKKKGIGIVQMPCPEQKAWGGVLKKKMLRGYGINKSFINNLLKIYINFFIWNTKRIYKKLAKDVVSQIKDYLDSGFEVAGIVGVKGSPSCGLSQALDMEKSADFVAGIDIEKLNRDNFNEQCYKNCLVGREGLFMEKIKDCLEKEGINIKFIEYDLLAEIKGEKPKIEL